MIAIVGSLLCFVSPYTQHYITLYLGRLVVGFHSGIVMVIIPALLVELAPLHLRGACGTINELTIVIGIAFANLMGLHFILGKTSTWHFLFRKSFRNFIFC